MNINDSGHHMGIVTMQCMVNFSVNALCNAAGVDLAQNWANLHRLAITLVPVFVVHDYTNLIKRSEGRTSSLE